MYNYLLSYIRRYIPLSSLRRLFEFSLAAGCTIQISFVVLAQRILLLINMAEREIEYNSEDTSNDAYSAKVPKQIGVFNNGGARKADDICDCVVEQVEGDEQASHVFRGARVRDAIRWNVDEYLRDTAKRIWNCNPLIGRFL